MKGPPGKSFINRMYKVDRAGGGMDTDDFQKLSLPAGEIPVSLIFTTKQVLPRRKGSGNEQPAPPRPLLLLTQHCAPMISHDPEFRDLGYPSSLIYGRTCFAAQKPSVTFLTGGFFYFLT